MRIVMMGTGSFCVPTFRSLLESPHDVAALITQPSKPTHGARRTPANPAWEVAQAHGLRVLQPADINAGASPDELAALRPELFVVCDYGQILSADVLSLAELGGINLHGSLLPKYRGAAPVHWALYHGEVETGVSVIHITPALDAGPTLTCRRTPIRADETVVELEARLARLGVEAVHEAIDMLQRWDRRSPLGAAQDRSLATKAPRLRKAHGRVDWLRTASQIANQVRALQPWPGTFTHWHRPDGSSVRLILCQVAALETPRSVSPPGTVQTAVADELTVATGDGTLRVLRIQPAGGRPMSAGQFLRGYPLKTGDVLEN